MAGRSTRHTLAWVEAINASGRAFLTPSLLDGRWMVRVSIGAESTERDDVTAVWDLMRSEAAADLMRSEAAAAP